MTLAEERQQLVLQWARDCYNSSTWQHHAANGDDAIILANKLIRKVVRWAIINDTNVLDTGHWQVATKWITTGVPWFRNQFIDSSVRGAWLFKVGQEKLPDFDTTTGRPVDWDAPDITGTLTEYDLDVQILGW